LSATDANIREPKNNMSKEPSWELGEVGEISTRLEPSARCPANYKGEDTSVDLKSDLPLALRGEEKGASKMPARTVVA